MAEKKHYNPSTNHLQQLVNWAVLIAITLAPVFYIRWLMGTCNTAESVVAANSFKYTDLFNITNHHFQQCMLLASKPTWMANLCFVIFLDVIFWIVDQIYSSSWVSVLCSQRRMLLLITSKLSDHGIIY